MKIFIIKNLILKYGFMLIWIKVLGSWSEKWNRIPCNNDPKPQSDKYIFHDPHFLDNIEIERSFSSPVYLKYLNIFGSVTINAGFLNYVSFSNSTFSEKVMLTSQDLDST